MFSFHLHCAGIPLCWYTPDKPKGERVNLVTARQKFDQEYTALPPEEVDELKHRAKEEQFAKTYVPKQVKRAQQHDVTKVANSIQQAVSEKSALSIIW
jgi:hypothetical protein